jgi:hypothetical protein
LGVAYTAYQAYTDGLLISDVPNTNFYGQADALISLQSAVRDVWKIYTEANDDYLMTSIYMTQSTFIVDGTRQYTYYYALPTDLYRLRLFQFGGQVVGTQYAAVQKATIENFGNTQQTPCYRMVGQTPAAPTYVATSTYTTGQYVYSAGIVYTAAQAVPVSTAPPNATYWTAATLNPTGYLAIYDPVGYQNWALWYYPQPITVSLNVAGGTGTDLGAFFPDNLEPRIFAYQIAIDIRRKQKLDTTLYEARRNEILGTLMGSMHRDDNKPEPIKDVFSQGFGPYF